MVVPWPAISGAGKIVVVGVGPKGGAYIDVLTNDAVSVGLVLFGSDPGSALPADERARRGAVLGLAQSAMTNGHDVVVVVERTQIQRIGVSKM